MTRYLFSSHFVILLFLVLVLWLCCTLCLSRYVSSSSVGVKEENENSVKEFNFDTIKENVQKSTDVPEAKITLTNINFLLFAADKNAVIAAVAEANYKTDSSGDSTEKVGVIATYFKDKSPSWTTQLVVEDNKKTKIFSIIRSFAANSEKDEIYFFLLNISDEVTGDQKWEFKIIKGIISSDKTIKWETTDLPVFDKVKEEINNKLKKNTVSLAAIDRFVFLTKTNKIMFVVRGELESSANEKHIAAVFQFEEGVNKLELVHHEKTKNSYPTFFQWEGKIFKISVENPTDGKKNVKQFDAGKKNFEETTNPIARLHSFLKDENNFITATIPEKGNVLLFTQQREINGDSGDGSKKNVYLWMTDGTRVSCAGAIFSNGLPKASYVSLLYTDNKLFALHQTAETLQTTNKIEFKLLTDQLNNIIKTLDAWKKSNNEIEKLYKDTPSPTEINFSDGIVGFLSVTKDNTNWEDGYSYANATLIPNKDGRKITKDGNGFTFIGTGAGAKWPVSKAAENQPYSFIDTGFTFLATVTVSNSGTNVSENSVLGVGLAGDTKKVGLWCAANGKWGVKVGKDDQTNLLSSEINCTRGEKYYVALILDQNKKISVYVNGEQIPKSDSGRIPIERLQNIDYFHFGVDKETENAKTDVTITDVLLYNRPFEDNKVKKLKPKKEKRVSPEQKREGDTSDLPQPDESTVQTDSSSASTSATPTATEKDGAETQLCLFYMSGLTMFLLLFGVFTLLGRYVY